LELSLRLKLKVLKATQVPSLLEVSLEFLSLGIPPMSKMSLDSVVS
jgi:hypothetical protein